MRKKNFSSTMLGIITTGTLLLGGCSFNVDFELPAPVVSDGTVYFYTMCDFTAADAKTGQIKWKSETARGEKEHFCEKHDD
ncbi:MAG: PQQ-like beta-propeller repeat protein [SAR324 cluster bacterium]|nr:PQQ-like beta-propeller repeat protein [SAR324 cluster bacterium]